MECSNGYRDIAWSVGGKCNGYRDIAWSVGGKCNGYRDIAWSVVTVIGILYGVW
jgi:hypothetical protein